jgi:hypothetical protein
MAGTGRRFAYIRWQGFGAVLWIRRIRIRMDPHHFCNLDPHPHQIKKQDSDPHQSDSWIRIRINFQMTSQNVRNMSLFEHFFKVLSLYLETRIWIRIRIRINKKSESGSASG